jgi:hypothetical protein
MAREAIIAGVLLFDLFLGILFLVSVWLLKSQPRDLDSSIRASLTSEMETDPASLFSYDSWDGAIVANGSHSPAGG